MTKEQEKIITEKMKDFTKQEVLDRMLFPMAALNDLQGANFEKLVANLRKEIKDLKYELKNIKIIANIL